MTAEKRYSPDIYLRTALSIDGARLIEISGEICGLVDREDFIAAVKRRCLSDIKQCLANLTAAVAEYERATFKAPVVTVAEYDALVAREAAERKHSATVTESGPSAGTSSRDPS